ncbi:hypothetical protein CROQUDRAFT_90405 [Cronartium quercuum f. sp. fusiforme G11]|uniref:Uncharacterized protein n=1 Tax=Cronartium quercuum f. sp. fusiforme G11 TaxID=708437 RepID=A0A9P6NMH9_9BASI|nr:hypothetical protein CROQUDRAFT_90405 [Cronartium quercuum f. sp. fusiforme G11]
MQGQQVYPDSRDAPSPGISDTNLYLSQIYMEFFAERSSMYPQSEAVKAAWHSALPSSSERPSQGPFCTVHLHSPHPHRIVGRQVDFFNTCALAINVDLTNVVTGSSLMVRAWPANFSEEPVTTFVESTVPSLELPTL